jgi:hypothetical protein
VDVEVKDVMSIEADLLCYKYPSVWGHGATISSLISCAQKLVTHIRFPMHVFRLTSDHRRRLLVFISYTNFQSLRVSPPRSAVLVPVLALLCL